MASDATVWLLGDQLHPAVGSLGGATPGDRVLLVESRGFAARKPFHPQKLTLVFSAMRHVRDDLREAGYEVVYEQADSFDDALASFFDDHPGERLVTMTPASNGAADRLRALVERHGGTLDLRENDLFLVSPAEFDEWAGDADRFRHESFYRFARRHTGSLMDGDEPAGGQWNYDEQNRSPPPADYDPPEPVRFDPDETTREVMDWVADSFDGWGDPDGFDWLVTRREALTALDDFVANRLPGFGTHQDAMVAGEWAMHHSLLSPAVNLGLLHPRELVEAAVEAYRDGEAPLAAVEGFVRQVVGWREFMRHVYRRGMPGLEDANLLGATRDLPPLYWDATATEMRCLAASVGAVYDHGYAHHIQRLMVLSNFALLAGVRPAALNHWFHVGFVDAYHWVTTPNVVGMGSFGTDAFTTKPYAASANYVDRMSDYCDACRFDPGATVGEDACPFNALYWSFLDEHEDDLRDRYRMGLVYRHWDDRTEGEREAVRERAATLRERVAAGDL